MFVCQCPIYISPPTHTCNNPHPSPAPTPSFQTVSHPSHSDVAFPSSRLDHLPPKPHPNSLFPVRLVSQSLRRCRFPPHASTTASPRPGMATSTITRLARVAATAAQSAKFKDAAIRGPASADPIGFPTEFSDIETAKARPNHAGSVRRWRSVNRPMSKGPVERPSRTIAAATTQMPFAKGSSAVAIVATRMGPAINHRSRPWLENRPATRAEANPAPPIAPHRSPTVEGPECSRPRTSTGTAMASRPLPTLYTLSVRARPRSVGFRTVYTSPSHAFLTTD